jgi:hypothetical protein
MPDDTRTVLDELDSKLTKSAASLDVYARAETRIDEHHRLLGKAEGLRLARSYIQDRIHTQADDCPHDSRSGDHTGRWRCDQCGTDTGPQEITAVHQLDALPIGTIIRQKGCLNASAHHHDGWWTTAYRPGRSNFTNEELHDNPAIVLYLPEAVTDGR